MPLVMLKKDWPGTFRRSIRDDKGKIISTLEFNPGEPVDISYDQLPAIEKDMFHALLPVTVDAKGHIVPIEEAEFRTDIVTAPEGDIEFKGAESGTNTGRRSRK